MQLATIRVDKSANLAEDEDPKSREVQTISIDQRAAIGQSDPQGKERRQRWTIGFAQSFLAI